jgi:DNA-binding transcriptional regulator YdaS (Cro superfamily)
MAGGVRAVSPANAVRIERATNGVVRRQDLRADWPDIWPELAIASVA